MPRRRNRTAENGFLAKCPTGIQGLDEITGGGLPRGRPTLVCGGAGCGKTLLAMEFIVRGIQDFNEPGVFLAFEETAEELAANVASLEFDVPRLIRQGKLAIDHVRLERSEIEEAGEYDLEGLFVRLGEAIARVGAKRVALDSVEALFAGLSNVDILRAELRRLFRWLKEKRVTVVITGEQGAGQLTRHGLEEYVSDCVLFLDHRVHNQVATRRLRIVKYRGTTHGTNEYPTLIDEHGLSVLPISSLKLAYPVSSQRVSTGIPRLDTMLGGKGYYRGSSILVSGSAGTGKTSVAAAFADSLCRHGGKCLYVAFEESPEQIIRNMRSIGYDLERWRKTGRLLFQAMLPTVYGLEMHLATIQKQIAAYRPAAVVMDPIGNLMSIGEAAEIKAMLTRAIDFLKNLGITCLVTNLTAAGPDIEQTEVGISSLMDTWLLVRFLEANGERDRLLYLLKSRGMAHSNQVREFVLTDRGIQLREVYLGPGTVLTGSARLVQETKDQAAAMADDQAAERKRREALQEQSTLNAQIAALQARLDSLTGELQFVTTQQRARRTVLRQNRAALAALRKAD